MYMTSVAGGMALALSSRFRERLASSMVSWEKQPFLIHEVIANAEGKVIRNEYSRFRAEHMLGFVTAWICRIFPTPLLAPAAQSTAAVAYGDA